jgi:hypothetical protein
LVLGVGDLLAADIEKPPSLWALATAWATVITNVL